MQANGGIELKLSEGAEAQSGSAVKLQAAIRISKAYYSNSGRSRSHENARMEIIQACYREDLPCPG